MKQDDSHPGGVAFKIINNTAAFIGGEFFYHFINFISGILVARSLGKEQYGEFSFIFVYLSFFEIFVQFGMNSILTRQLAQKKESAPKLLGNAVLLRLVLIGGIFPVVLFLIRLLGYPLSVQQGVLIASFQLFLGVRSIYETIFRANLLMIYPALWNGLRAILNLLVIAGVAHFQPSLSFFILSYLGTGFIGLVGIIVSSHRLTPITFGWDWNLTKSLIRESAPLVFSGYLTLLYYRIDVFMLSVMKTFSDVGHYSVATRLTESLDIVSTSLMISLFPLLSRAFKEDRPRFDRLLSKAFEGLLLVGLPMALGGTIVAKDLIVPLFGMEYAASGTTLGILFWYTFFGFFSTCLVNVLIVCGRQVVDAWVSFFLVLGNVGMNFFLIPRYSYNGAAIATVLTEVIGTSVMLIYALRHPAIRFPFPAQGLWTALKVNSVFLLSLLALKALFQIHVAWFILIGIFIYALLILGMRLVSFRDLRSYFAYGMKVMSGART